MIRVVIADDQPLIRQGFRMILTAQGDIAVVGEAADGEEAVRLAHTTNPDVVLMDVRMPGLDGIEATRRLPGIKVLILTTFGHDDYVVAALRAGASGFILKDITPEELVHAVRVVAAGDAILAPAVTTQMISRFATSPHPESTDHLSGLSELTGREHEIFILVAAGLSNPAIATRLSISENTVKTHVSHVFGKLDLKDRVHALLFAIDRGLMRQVNAVRR